MLLESYILQVEHWSEFVWGPSRPFWWSSWKEHHFSRDFQGIFLWMVLGLQVSCFFTVRGSSYRLHVWLIGFGLEGATIAVQFGWVTVTREHLFWNHRSFGVQSIPEVFREIPVKKEFLLIIRKLPFFWQLFLNCHFKKLLFWKRKCHPTWPNFQL